MLRELRIRNFAIIDELHVTFAPGLNVLTGETGAGKSLLVDAVSAVLGARAQPEWLRAGASFGFVEAVFELKGHVRTRLQAMLREQGLEGEEEDILVLARELRANGRSVARVNGRTVTASLLAEIGALLVDIHGQGEHLSLLRPRHQLALLDRYAHLEDLRAAVTEEVARWRSVKRELDDLRARERELAQRADLLAYQVQEIERANLQPGEEELLETERRRLANAEEILEALETAIQALEGELGATPGAIDLLGEAGARLRRVGHVDPELASIAEQVDVLAEQVADVLRTLARYRDHVEYNPERLTEVEERLALIHTLKRKYGDTIEEILAYAAQAAQELETIEHADERIAALAAEEAALRERIGALAGELSARRRQAGEQLAQAVEAVLADLHMPHTRFRVALEQDEDPDGVPVGERRLACSSTGVDRVQFLVSTNPGEPFRPLAKIASGGETARLMLALKTVLAQADPVPVLIFDEIDVGIGGRLGHVVGQKLRELARHHQVLCVTHLPQVAAYGHHHLNVRKRVAAGRARVEVQPLEGEARLQELAAMLGSPTDTGLRSAQEMLRAAQES